MAVHVLFLMVTSCMALPRSAITYNPPPRLHGGKAQAHSQGWEKSTGTSVHRCIHDSNH
jgi:hypothetical protein